MNPHILTILSTKIKLNQILTLNINNKHNEYIRTPRYSTRNFNTL